MTNAPFFAVSGNIGPELVRAKTEVMAAAGYVQKQGKMSAGAGGSYSFAGERHIIEKVQPAMIAAGLTLSPIDYEIVGSGEKPTRTGGVSFWVRVKAYYRLSHASGQWEIVSALGEGADSGDKSIPKALTGAYKYAIRNTFMIETGDDPDEDRPENDWAEPKGKGKAVEKPKGPSAKADAKADKPTVDPFAATVKAIEEATTKSRLDGLRNIVNSKAGDVFTDAQAEDLHTRIGNAIKRLDFAASSVVNGQPAKAGA